MISFKRNDNDKLRLICSECGTMGIPISSTSKVIKCPKCKNCWDGVAQEAEKHVYEEMKRFTDRK